MKIEEYNRISMLYQTLTRRFDIPRNYQYEGIYHSYNPDQYAVKGENLQTLRCFEHLTLRHILNPDYINDHLYSDVYLDSELLIIDENKIKVHGELGQILFYILISKLEPSIKSFIDLLNHLKNNHKGFIRSDDEDRIYKMKVYTYDDFVVQFEAIENYKFVYHLFGKTDSLLMMRNWDNEIEINVADINKILETVKKFNFQNVDLNF